MFNFSGRVKFFHSFGIFLIKRHFYQKLFRSRKVFSKISSVKQIFPIFFGLFFLIKKRLSINFFFLSKTFFQIFLDEETSFQKIVLIKQNSFNFFWFILIKKLLFINFSDQKNFFSKFFLIKKNFFLIFLIEQNFLFFLEFFLIQKHFTINFSDPESFL